MKIFVFQKFLDVEFSSKIKIQDLQNDQNCIKSPNIVFDLTCHKMKIVNRPAQDCKKSSKRNQKLSILAHQWFGNLVTPSWWTDLWLNEGFASYVEYLGVEAVQPELKLLEQFIYLDLQSVFKIDALESSHPISIPVGHPDEINEIFDRISYAKGASIIRMMDKFLSEETFRKGLSNYLTKL